MMDIGSILLILALLVLVVAFVAQPLLGRRQGEDRIEWLIEERRRQRKRTKGGKIVTCVKCGEEIDPGKRVCPKCGHKVA